MTETANVRVRAEQAAGGGPGAAWGMRHGDAQNTDCARVPGTAFYRAAWRALPDTPAATFAAVDGAGRITVLTLNGAQSGRASLWSFEADGTPRWASAIARPSLTSIAVSPEGDVFVADGERLTGLDADGKARWHASLPVEVSGLHLLAKGLVLAPGTDASLRVFEAATGAPAADALRLPSGPMPWGTAGRPRAARRRERHLARSFREIGADRGYAPQAARRFLGIGVAAKNVPAVDPASGRIFVAAADETGRGGALFGVDLSGPRDARGWRTAFRTDMGPGCDSSPGVSAKTGRVYCPDREGRLYAFDGATGAVAWTLATGGGSSASFAVAGDRLYGALHDEMVCAEDRGSEGAVAWAAGLAGIARSRGFRAARLNSVPIVAGDYVSAACAFGRRRLGVFVPEAHALLTFDRQSGRLSGQSPLPHESCCTLSMGPDGTLLVPSKPLFKGVVMALRRRVPLPFLKVSPQFHGLTALAPCRDDSSALEWGEGL